MNKILVLDDDPQILKMTTLMLKKGGHQVVTAANGKEALPLLKSEQVDLLLTDILMPEMDGIEVINHCRKHHAGIKIVAMSGGRRKISAEFNLKSARMLGASAILPKPFSQEQLMASVASALR